MKSEFPEPVQPEIVEGITVQLKSGGQTMTTETVVDGQVACLWFDKGQVRRDVFPSHVLKVHSEGGHMTLIMNLGEGTE